jgi:hypothetical protein
MLGGMAILGTLRGLITGERILPAIIGLGVILCALILVKRGQKADWLLHEDGLGETGSIQTTADPKSNKKFVKGR